MREIPLAALVAFAASYARAGEMGVDVARASLDSALDAAEGYRARIDEVPVEFAGFLVLRPYGRMDAGASSTDPSLDEVLKSLAAKRTHWEGVSASLHADAAAAALALAKGADAVAAAKAAARDARALQLVDLILADIAADEKTVQDGGPYGQELIDRKKALLAALKR